LKATWDQFDLKSARWTKPSSHTKQRAEHQIPLSAPALQLLTEMRDKADPDQEFVFPSPDGEKPQQEIRRVWRRACKEAGITGARIHDLRHSYASILASAGLSLPIIGRLL